MSENKPVTYKDFASLSNIVSSIDSELKTVVGKIEKINIIEIKNGNTKHLRIDEVIQEQYDILKVIKAEIIYKNSPKYLNRNNFLKWAYRLIAVILVSVFGFFGQRLISSQDEVLKNQSEMKIEMKEFKIQGESRQKCIDELMRIHTIK